MGIPQSIPLGTGFYVSESLPNASIECQNFYVNVPEAAGISGAQLYSTPGLVQQARSGETDSNRGAHVLNEQPYFVNGNVLYRLEADNALTNLGAIEGTGFVSMADNGTQLLIVVPGTRIGYIYTVAGGLVQITDATFLDPAKAAPEICVFIGGFFVISRGSKEFFHSNLNNGLVYNALDFGSAEADPDIIRSLHVYKNQLYVFGSETIEVFNLVGGAGFVFQRIQGFVIPKGIAAPFSVTDFDGSFAFVGQGVNESPKVYVWAGSGVTPISHTAVDILLQSANDIENIFAWNYTFRGATFLGFSSDSSGTFVFDSKASSLAGAKVWHTRLSRNLQDKNRWRVNSIVTAYNKLLVGDSESGRIGEINNDVFTEYDNTVRRIFSLPTFENNSEYLTFNYVETVIDSGQGQINEDEPQIYMEYTDDARTPYRSRGGRGAGKVGQFNVKQRWQQLSSTNRYRIFRFICDAPVRWTILKMLVNVDG